MTTQNDGDTAVRECRTCRRCRREQAIAEFRISEGWRRWTCRECESAALAQQRQSTPDRYRAGKIEWRRRNVEKARAQAAVLRAVKRGAILKQPCERCGGENSHAHHDDYSQPLTVRWLCPIHHAERHAELGWGVAGTRSPTGDAPAQGDGG